MDHEGVRALMATAVEGGLSADSERELAVHLVTCRECNALYQGLQQAQVALGRLAAAAPPTRAIETAVHRATTVLRGEADPGPVARAPTVPPPLGAGRDEGPSVGPVLAEDSIAAPPPLDDQPPLPSLEIPAPIEPEPEPLFFDQAEGSAQPPPREEIHIIRPDALPPRMPPTVPVSPPPVVAPPAPVAHPPVAQPGEEWTTPSVERTEVPASAAPPPLPTFDPSSGIPPELLEEAGYDPNYSPPEEEERPRMGPGPWLAAIAATVVLAILAGFLVFRSQGFFGGGGDLPDAEDVRARVERTFAELKSLKTSFEIRRLDLYPTRREDDSLTYTFSRGQTTGTLAYDRADGYREVSKTEVQGQEVSQTSIVRTPDETRTIVGTGDDARLVVLRNAPLGPPDADHTPLLGSLERSVGYVARLIADSGDIEIVGLKKLEDRDVVQIRFDVDPSVQSRADKIEVLLDTRTYFPVYIRRTVGRENASVLGSEDLLGSDKIAQIFADRERIITELVELTNVVPDDLILPGDLVLEEPAGDPQTSDGGFRGVSRGELSGKIDFTPLFPRGLPPGFEEQSLAVYSGEPHAWGPGNAYPAPQGVIHASYFDGKTTIVVTQRRMETPFALDGSPLRGKGLPVETSPTMRAEKRFFFGISPEVPPHAYGFLGNTFVMATGYVPRSDLIDIVSTMVETPLEQPDELAVSPSPGATSSPLPTTTSTP